MKTPTRMPTLRIRHRPRISNVSETIQDLTIHLQDYFLNVDRRTARSRVKEYLT